MTMPFDKYRPYETVDLPDRRWPNVVLSRAPIWSIIQIISFCGEFPMMPFPRRRTVKLLFEILKYRLAVDQPGFVPVPHEVWGVESE